MFPNRKEKLKDYTDFNSRLIKWVGEHRHFSVRIGPSRFLFSPSKRKRFKIYLNVLDKFIPLAGEFHIYDLNCSSDIVKPFLGLLDKHGSRYKIMFDNGSWRTFDKLLYSPPFKGTIKEIRGGITGKCRLDEQTLRSIFEHCYDPTVIDNAGVSCGRNALNAAKRTEKSGVFFIIIETLNNGLESITFVSNKKDILHIYELAAGICKISRNYRNFHIRIYDRINSKKLKKV